MSHSPDTTPVLHGLLAEFDSAQQLLDATTRARQAGFTRTEAYSPFPIHGLAEAIGFRERLIPKLVFTAGLIGGTSAFMFQWWMAAVDYPLNIGGRPYFSWVSFIPVSFEVTILFASFTAVISMLVLNGLPRPYHAVFNAPQFARASQDRFFLAIEASDPRFHPEETRTFLSGLNPREVVAVDE